MTSEKPKIRTGTYKVTKGEYQSAELIVTKVESPEESEFVYLTIYNPDSDESHKIELG